MHIFVSSATIAPELIIHSEFGGSFLTNPGFLVPVLSALIVAIGLGAGLVWYWRKNSLRGKKGESNLQSLVESNNSELRKSKIRFLPIFWLKKARWSFGSIELEL